jgi:hypothetical protein
MSVLGTPTTCLELSKLTKETAQPAGLASQEHATLKVRGRAWLARYRTFPVIDHHQSIEPVREHGLAQGTEFSPAFFLFRPPFARAIQPLLESGKHSGQ